MGPEAHRNSRTGGAAVNVLVFVGGTLLILAGVIWIQKSRQPAAPAAPATPAIQARTDESGVTTVTDGEPTRPMTPVAQPRIPGLTPQPAPRTPAVTPTTPATYEPPPPPKRAEPLFIGDDQYKRYHRPNCKYVAMIAPGKKVEFFEGDDPFARGFIPCKVCNPEVPSQEVEPPAPPVTTVKTTTRPEPTPAVAEMESVPVSNKLVGDADRHRYHRSDCKFVKLIKPGSLVDIKSPSDALDRDFYPCRTCNPDLPTQMADLPRLEQPVKRGVPVNLTDRDKRAMFKSLWALKQMLKGISTPTRPYEVLSDRYHVPVSAVEAVETEGNAGRWAKE